MTSLVFIHLPWLEWLRLQREVDSGRLRALSWVMENGLSGRLKGAERGIASFASAVTGVGGLDHGLVARDVPRPDGMGVAPAARDSLAADPLWEWLDRAGKQCAILGLPATQFSQLEQGVVLADCALQLPDGSEKDWAFAPGSLSPSRLGPELAKMRLHPELIMREQVEHISNCTADDLAHDTFIEETRWLARITSLHSIATHFVGSGEAEFTAVEYRTRFPDQHEDVVMSENSRAVLIDAFIARLITMAPKAHYLIMGGEIDQSWLALTGDKVAKDGLLPSNARLIDVVQTALAILRLAPPSNLPGRSFLQQTDRPKLEDLPEHIQPGEQKGSVPKSEVLLSSLPVNERQPVSPTGPSAIAIRRAHRTMNKARRSLETR